jgi:hypothetical protein
MIADLRFILQTLVDFILKTNGMTEFIEISLLNMHHISTSAM